MCLVFVREAKAQVPEVINVQGFVFNNDSSRAENGVIVKITNLNKNQTTYTQVYAPPIPSLKGAYSGTITGTVGDILEIYAYNATYYGQITKAAASVTYANITLNKSRAETKTTITFPLNNTVLNVSRTINVTANITAIIGDVQNCEATIYYSDSQIINYSSQSEQTKSIGDITLGNTVVVNFEAITLSVGTLNITVSSNCSSNSVYFENKSIDKVVNINVVDAENPEIYLISPVSDAIIKSSNYVSFNYNVSDFSSITSCSLYANAVLRNTSYSVQKDTVQIIDYNLSNGLYSWNIACTDSFGNTNYSETRLLNLSVYNPEIINMILPTNIILNAGGDKVVNCNATIRDNNSATDINSVSAVFYATNATGGTSNYNDYYENSTCISTGSYLDVANYSCDFTLKYYAYNGTWYCNVTAIDNQGLKGNGLNISTVDPLFAIFVPETVIDYGDVETNAISDQKTVEIINVGNQNLEIFTKGYGGSDPVIGDGKAMLCESGDVIDVDYERYSLNEFFSYNQKNILTSSYVNTGINLSKQTVMGENKSEHLYWQIQVPPMVVTNCSGTVVLSVVGS